MKLNAVSLFSSALAVTFFAVHGVHGAASVSTNAISDAFVSTGPTGDLSTNNYGGGGALALAASNLPLGEFQSVVQFDLSGARSSFDAQFGQGQWIVQAATLRLGASTHNNVIYNDIAAGSFNVSLMQNNSWVEGTGNASLPTTDGITFESLQSTYININNDQALGSFSFGGGSSGTNSYSLALTSGLIAHAQAGDLLSLRLYAADNHVSYLFTSHTGGNTATRPTLILNAVSAPSVTGLARTNGQFTFSFGAESNLTFTVEFSSSLAPGSWTTLTNIPSQATARTIVISDLITSTNRFYRVRVP